ncbi:MAG: Mrp/NBP35 family ATP-binding protein [Candidatus Korarchaeum sp.]
MIDPIFGKARSRLRKVGKITLVASGKGGVGKSLVAASLALISANKGYRTGLLDLDVHGPSIPRIFGFDGELMAGRGGLVPPVVSGLRVMSPGFMVGRNPVPLRGESKMSLLSFLLAITDWGDLDHLVVDIPPGTGDETIFCLRVLRGLRAGAIVVTTPSSLSQSVVMRLISLLRGEGFRIHGLVENMAYINCCGRFLRPFGSIDEDFLRDCGLRLLASLPIDPSIEERIREGRFPELPEEFRSRIEELLDGIMGEVDVPRGTREGAGG